MIKRRLQFQEKWGLYFNTVSIYAMQAFIGFEFDLCEKLLLKSLDVIQKRHYYLNTFIDIKNFYDAEIIFDNKLKIPFRIINADAEFDVSIEMEKELNSKIEFNYNPLIKILLIKKKEISYLIITLNHSIGDGISVMCLLDDILNVYKQLECNCIPDINNLVIQPGMLTEANFPDNIPDNIIFMLPPQGSIIEKKNIQMEKRYTHMVQIFLGKSETDSLVQYSKNHDISVFYILNAILLLTLYNDLQNNLNIEPINIYCGSPVNLRPYLKSPLDKNQLGAVYLTLLTHHSVNRNSLLIDIARDVKNKLESIIDRKEAFTFFYQLKAFIESSPNPGEMLKASEFRYPCISVSNLGKLQMPACESFNVQSIGFGAALNSWLPNRWGVYVAVNHYNEKLFMNFEFLEPYWNRDEASVFVKKALENISLLCR